MADAILTIRDCPGGDIEMYPQYGENDALDTIRNLVAALEKIENICQPGLEFFGSTQLMKDVYEIATKARAEASSVSNGLYDKRSNAHRTLVLVRKVLEHLLPRSANDRRELPTISPALRAVVEEVRNDPTVIPAMESEDGV